MNKQLLVTAAAFVLYSTSAMAQTQSAQKNNTATEQQPISEGKPNLIRCGTAVPSAEWDEAFNKQVEAYKLQHADEIANGKAMGTTYTIPMVFHVIYGSEAVGTFPNIAAAQIQSQITVLNQDYAGIGYGVTTYTALTKSGKGPFYDYATANTLPAPDNTTAGILPANCGITFMLATKDPTGKTMTEPGIDRVSYTAKGWANPNSTAYNTVSTFQSYIDGTIKKNTIWDPTKYFNVWLTDEATAVGLLGYSTFPPGYTYSGNVTPDGTSTTDGCWFWTKVCGSKNIYAAGTYDPTYYLGRTITHESGHYFSLRHTWGDGKCVTDYCNDTPPEAASTFYGSGTNSTSYVYAYTATNNCTGTGAYGSDNGDGIMYENFMDYSDDAYMCMFTNDQLTRIKAALTSSPNRSNLTASANSMTGTTDISSIHLNSGINLFPNPNNGSFNFAVNLPLATNLNFTVVNVIGQVVYSKIENNISNAILSCDLSNLAKGVYYVNITDSNANKAVKKIVIE